MSPALAWWLYFNCGLCAIPRLRDMGVNVVKIPSRGLGFRKRIRLEAVKRVIDHPNPTPKFCRDVNGSPDFCSRTGSCYYALDNSAWIRDGSIVL